MNKGKNKGKMELWLSVTPHPKTVQDGQQMWAKNL
jgi:hypothetical protein